MDVQMDPPEQFDWELVFIGLVIYVLHHLNEPVSQWYIHTKKKLRNTNMNITHTILMKETEKKLSLFWFFVSFVVEHHRNVVIFSNNLKMV